MNRIAASNLRKRKHCKFQTQINISINYPTPSFITCIASETNRLLVEFRNALSHRHHTLFSTKEMFYVINVKCYKVS